MGTEIDTSDLIDFASDPAFGVDYNMQITGWNDGAAELLGYPHAEVIGRKCSQILQAYHSTGEPLCSVLCEGRSCFMNGEKWGIDTCQIRHKDGTMITAGISSLVLPAEARNNTVGETVSVIFLRQTSGETSNNFSESPMRIFSLGRFGLALSGKGLNIESWKRKQAAIVLKCLVCHLDRPVHRERLIEWLWPEASSENGWQRLKVTVSYLRGELRRGGANNDIIETVGQSYLLRRSAVWVDSDVFCTLVSDGWKLLKTDNLSNAQVCFEEAENLYRGDYFEEEPYAEWCAVERERLFEIFLELLSGLASCYTQQGKYMEASRICRVALSKDPCRENFVRALMENLVNLGRPDWARAHFLTWRKNLDDDFSLQPTQETLLVFSKLIGNTITEAG